MNALETLIQPHVALVLIIVSAAATLIFFETNRVTLHIFGKSEARARQREAPHQRGLEIFEAVLEEGLREGSFRLMNVQRVGQLIVGALVGFLESLDHGDAALDMDSDFKEIMRFCLHGLSPMR